MNKKKLIKLTKNDLYNIINESVKTLITESQESKSQSEAIKLVMDKLGYSYEDANNVVRKYLRQDVTALRDKNIAKFTLGVTRMYCNRELSDARIINDLNATLKLLSAHLNEYDRNLNGISAQELIDKFAQTRQDNIDAEKGEIDSMDFSQGSRYQIVPINSFEEAQNYYEYTNPDSRWCLTHMNDMFDSYTSDGINQIYFCLREGFESEPYDVGENAPLDDYGLSMLSIIVNEKGELAYCTTRWNHDNGGTDSSMSAKEVSQVVGVNFYQVFKPNNKWQNLIYEVKEKISRGVPYNDIFDNVGRFINEWALVELNRKHNFINTNGEFISDQWFDGASDFNDGYARVDLNRKYNFIDTNREFISDQWFNYAYNFKNGYARVVLNRKWNFINTKKEIVSDQWFDYVIDFYNGYARVKLDGKINFINTNGEFVSNQCFENAGDFKDGCAWVRLNGKFNFINTKGDIISDQCFDDICNFSNGYARVELDDKYNFINTNGDIISDQWFDGASDFKDGYASVRINGKTNFINTNGDIISDQWFDYVGAFNNELAIVGLNGEYYTFNLQDGKIYNMNENKQYNNMSKKKVNESFTPSKLILMGVLRKVSDELYDKGYDEDKIDNFINNRNIQLGMDGDGYTFLFNNEIMFHIEPFPQLNDVIDNASQNMIQWFENKINNIQENKIMSKKQLIRLTEGDLHKIIKESVNRILNENEDDFTPHGYKGTSNFGGYEMQIDDRGEMARLKDSHTGNITDWMEIQFDEEGVAYVIDENGNEERLCDYMRY